MYTRETLDIRNNNRNAINYNSNQLLTKSTPMVLM